MRSLWRAFRYLKRHWPLLVIGLGALLLVDSVQLLIPKLVQWYFDALGTPRFTSWYILRTSLAIFAISLSIGVFRFLWRLTFVGVSFRVDRDIRRDFFDHLQKLSVGFHARRKIGELMALATNDLNAVRMAVGMGLILMVDAIFMGIVCAVMMLHISWKLTLFAALPCPFITILVLTVGRVLHRRFKEQQKAYADVTEHVQETISGIRVIQGYTQEENFAEQYSGLNRNLFRAAIRVAITWGMFGPVVHCLVSIAIGILLYFGGKAAIFGDISTGMFVAFFMYLQMIAWPFMAVGWLVNLFQRGGASMLRLSEVMDADPDIKDAPDAIEMESLTGPIEIRNLDFKYDDTEEPVLHDLSVTFEKGKTTGIIGRTGSGKTTLIDLLLRLHDPPEGTVFFDGTDVRKLKVESLRRSIGIVPQDSFLFSDSIAQNIAFGRTDAPEELIQHAAEVSQLIDDIRGFPQGFDTLVGERGVTLSGGQRQRTAIARALLLDPNILILDDSLSAIDVETEEAILDKLRDVRKGKTCLIVSHRILTVKDADNIVVLECGKITQSGTHDELVEKEGLYADLYRRQQLQRELEQFESDDAKSGVK
ncbi:MAG: ABC transporter ATP-binding protein [Planctomycetota bacterium]|nr:MAG: ABC transporter ATP-binding protein [Planctomycetota bacterium]